MKGHMDTEEKDDYRYELVRSVLISRLHVSKLVRLISMAIVAMGMSYSLVELTTAIKYRFQWYDYITCCMWLWILYQQRKTFLRSQAEIRHLRNAMRLHDNLVEAVKAQNLAQTTMLSEQLEAAMKGYHDA